MNWRTALFFLGTALAASVLFARLPEPVQSQPAAPSSAKQPQLPPRHVPPAGFARLDDYTPRTGDIVFQALPPGPVVLAIEGATRSPFSHCGMVFARADGWHVVEAIGNVCETPLEQWVNRGRDGRFWVYRHQEATPQQNRAMVDYARARLGMPYDIRYQMDDAKWYCSELLYKAHIHVFNKPLGELRKLGELNWRPYFLVILGIEGALPLDREMITPVDLSRAPELAPVAPAGSSARPVVGIPSAAQR